MYPVTVTGIWLESCLYGVYGAVFYAYMYLRRNSGLGKGTSPRVVWVLIILFILSTVSLVLEYAHGMVGPGYFALYDDGQATSQTYTENVWRNFNYALMMQFLTHGIYTTKQIFADGLLIYRCYTVWSSNVRIIVLPCVLIVVTAVFGYMEAITELRQVIISWGMSASDPHRNSGKWAQPSSLGNVYSIVAILLSLSGNIVITSLTAWRIYVLSREFKTALGRRIDDQYSVVIAMIIESGAIFSLSLLVWLIVDALRYKLVATFVVFPCVNQIAGIVPSIIAVHMSLRKSSDQTFTLPTISNGVVQSV